MPKGRSTSGRAEQDDSLVVHPATQGAAADSSFEIDYAEEEIGSDTEEAEADSQGFWEAEAIIDETPTQYRIKWKGKNEDGDPWKPTWEPKENANAELVESWVKHGKPEMKAQRMREAEEKKRAKAEKKKAKERRSSGKKASSVTSKARSSTGSTASAADSAVRVESDEPEEPPARSTAKAKRKMVVPDSDSSQSQSQTVAKKQKTAVGKGKKVAFEIVLDDEADEEAQEQSVLEAQPPQKKAAPEPVEQDSQEASRPAPSSGETSTLSLVPDSQTVPGRAAVLAEVVEDSMVASQEPVFAGPVASSSRPRQPLQLDSPTSSHSGYETQHLDDDVPLFDPLRPANHRSPSVEGEDEQVQPHRRLGPVPIPPISAFGLHGHANPASSQLDPIEDPDSSPHRSPFRQQRPQLTASPVARPPRPAKTRLELVTVDDSPASSFEASFEAEVASSAAASYVSLPITVGNAVARPPGGSPIRPFTIRTASTSTTAVKRAPFRPPTPPAEAEIAVGGAAVAAVARPLAAPRAFSPEAVEETQISSQVEEVRDFAQEFIDEFLDFSELLQEGMADGEATDAGEGYPPAGYGGYGSGAGQNGAAGSAPSAPAPSQIPGYIPAAAGVSMGGYGFAGAPGHPGGAGLPPMQQLPPSHAIGSPAPAATKRDRDGDGDAASKKPRTDQYGQPLSHAPASTPAPLAANPYPAAPIAYPLTYYAPQAHAAPPQPSPYYPPSQPSLPPSQHAPYSAYPAQPPPSAYPAAAPPALNVISPSPVGAPTSSPAPIPAPANGRPAVPPSPATSAAAKRSPSPLSSTAVPGSTSRNGSPVSGGKVDEVISLVKTSPYILETDGTKIEIEKFLRDPRAYIALTDAPLARSEFWAFELRHLTVDGVDKVDFIILRSREGNFQLKRALAGNLSVDFARSLSHASSHVRGSTPAGEAVSTIAASSPAPAGPPAPSTMTRDQLEQEVERLRAAFSAAETELVTLRPAAADAAKLKLEVATLQKSNKQLQASRESTQSDVAYMQAQYQMASSAAVERANEARVAEADAARLRGLLDEGLKQKELVYAAREKRLKEECAKLTKETRFYRETQRRTDASKLREKAAKWDEHVAAMREKEEIEKRRAAGEVVDEDADLDDDELPCATESSADGAAVDAAAASSQPSFTTAVAGGDISMSAFPSSSAASGPEPSTLSSTTFSGTQSALPVAPTAAALASSGEFRCEWRMGTDSQAEACGAVCPSRVGLHTHVMGHLGA
ncbi:hypothetical protein JCM10213_000350 [Rhodosporidiobolus nylandii]